MNSQACVSNQIPTETRPLRDRSHKTRPLQAARFTPTAARSGIVRGEEIQKAAEEEGVIAITVSGGRQV